MGKTWRGNKGSKHGQGKKDKRDDREPWKDGKRRQWEERRRSGEEAW